MTSICPYHKRLLSQEFKSEKYQNIIAEFLSFFKELQEGTDLENVDIHMALRICDAITVWSQLNLTLPHWVNSDSINKCIELGNIKFIISYSNMLLTKFRGGPLVHNVINSMENRARSYLTDKSGMKMIGFFAHDSTISAFLSHLGGFNQLKPPLASIVIMELYYDPNAIIVDNEPLSQFHVRLLFRNNTSSSPHVLKLSICDNDQQHRHSTQFDSSHFNCRLDILQRSLQPHILSDLPRECGLSNIIDYWFASSDKLKLNHDALVIHDGESKSSNSKPKYESDLLVNILFPLLLVEILVLFIFYRVFKK